MLHCFTPGLTCLYNVSLTSSQGGFEAETLLWRCWWETWGSLSSANNSGFVSSSTWLCLCDPLWAPLESLDVSALSRDPGSRYWVHVLEQTQRRASNKAGVQSESGEVPWRLRTKPDFLAVLLLLVLILRLCFPVNSAISPPRCKEAESLVWRLWKPRACYGI